MDKKNKLTDEQLAGVSGGNVDPSDFSGPDINNLIQAPLEAAYKARIELADTVLDYLTKGAEK